MDCLAVRPAGDIPAEYGELGALDLPPEDQDRLTSVCLLHAFLTGGSKVCVQQTVTREMIFVARSSI